MRKFSSLGLLLVVASLSLSCIRFHGPEGLRRDLSRQAGVRLDREVGLTVTRSGMWLARLVMKSADEEMISLKGVRRMELGVYEVRGTRRGVEQASRIDLSGLLEEWEPLVRVHDEGEEVAVLVQADERQKISEMLVLVAEDDEWILIKMKGKLDSILEEAMRMAFDEVDRPELYEKTRVERGLDSAEGPTPSRRRTG